MKICKLCGESFKARRPDQIYCKNPHQWTCFHCGAAITPTLRSFKKRYACSSKECRAEAIRLSNLETIGVENVAQSNEVRLKISEAKQARTPEDLIKENEKRKQTMLERYGVEYPLQDSKFFNKSLNTLKSNYGVDNPAKSDIIKNKISETVLEKYGVNHIFKADEVKEKIKATNSERRAAKKALKEEPERKTKRSKKSVLKERKCYRCGEMFIPDKKGQQICKRRHFRSCLNCGGQYPWTRGRVTCSNECASDLRMKTSTLVKTCAHCNSEFKAIRKSQIFCSGPHSSTCIVCAQEFPIANAHRVPKTCSSSCASALTHTPEARAARRANNLKKYGVEYTTQREDVKAKMSKSLEGTAGRFGTEASKAAMKAKFGHENYSRTEAAKEQKRQASLARYGVDNPAKSPEVQKKMRATMKERYGVEHALQNPEFKAKAIKNAAKSRAETLRKIKETNLKRYGVEFTLAAPDVREKIKNTNLKKYGYEVPSQAPIVQERMRETNLERYGVENCFQSEEIKKKIRETMLERYGAEYVLQVEEFKQKAARTIEARVNSGDIRSFSRVSKLNRSVAKKIQETTGTEVVFEKAVGNFSYDLFVPEINLLLDINPTISHNSTMGFGCFMKSCEQPCESHPAVSPSYHFDRAKRAVENGYELIQAFDWCDMDRIVSFISAKISETVENIPSQGLEVRKIDKAACSEFLNLHHIQGGAPAQGLCYGLFYNSILVAVESFSKHPFSGQWELLRYAIKSGYRVPGAANRLFDKFLKDVNPETVASNLDFNYSIEASFLDSLGFAEREPSGPVLVWHHLVDGRLISDSEVDYGSDSTLLSEGFVKVFTAGNRRFVWCA